jgi:acetyl-CoA acetyltransferase
MADRRAKVAVLGLGYSKVRRDLDTQSLGADAIDASRAAIADAGLTSDDIDGVTGYKYRPDYYGVIPPPEDDGVMVVSPQYLWRKLAFPNLKWGEWNDKFVGSSFIEAHNAIAGGACRYALVIRACNYARGTRYAQVDPDYARGLDLYGQQQLTVPYGQHGGPMSMSMFARRYYDVYGATREHMATFVVASRRHALMSGRGYWAENRPEPMTVDDYMSAKMISEPFGLYDCDIPVQGAVAYVLGPAEAAQDAPGPAAYVKGCAQAFGGPGGPETFMHLGGRGRPPHVDSFSWESNLEVGRQMAANLWADTGLQPSDIATANLYDGFSIIAWSWLEALGFCGEGEAFEFVQDGRTEVGGQLPINTSGGNLGEGRLHGAPHISEAIYQAMGRAGERQVPNARYTLAAPDRVAVGQVIVFSSEPT